MFSNKIDTYTPVKDGKLSTQSNSTFDFEGEGFSSMLEQMKLFLENLEKPMQKFAKTNLYFLLMKKIRLSQKEILKKEKKLNDTFKKI